MSDANSTAIAAIQKNNREEIRVQLGEYKGFDLVSVRVWAQSRDTGEYIPTRAGINCRVALLPTLIEALQAAEDKARAAGLL